MTETISTGGGALVPAIEMIGSGTLSDPYRLAEWIEGLPRPKVDRPGVWDLHMDSYHDDICVGPSISSSGVRRVWADSPAHYHYDSPYNPFPPELTQAELERPHFSLGRATHHLLFMGRKGFDEQFVIRPEKYPDYRTNAAKEWKAEQLRNRLTIITDNELKLIVGMARSLAAHPMVKAGILNGYVERSLIYRDKATGMWVKSRPDNIPNDSGDYSDLKTTVSVKTDAIQRTLAEYGYHVQAGITALASREVLNREMLTFSLVFVEKDPPHCVRIVQIRPGDLDMAIQQIEHVLEIVAEAHATGVWHGPAGDQQDAEFMDLAAWGRKAIEDRLAIIAYNADHR